MLLYAQPNPDWIRGGIGVGGWSTRFPGGRGAWENYFTEARCTDWFAFRDPEGRWQKPYVAEKADQWRTTGRLFSTFDSHTLHRRADRDWVETMIGEHLGAIVLHDYGLFMALASPIRDSTSRHAAGGDGQLGARLPRQRAADPGREGLPRPGHLGIDRRTGAGQAALAA